jgi:hypothetical protein
MPSRPSRESDLSAAFFGMLGALIVINLGDILTTNIILSRGGVELAATSGAWQRALGLPLWSVCWLLAHLVGSAFLLLFWYASLGLEDVAPSSAWGARAFRALLLLALLGWNFWHALVVAHNLQVIFGLPILSLT